MMDSLQQMMMMQLQSQMAQAAQAELDHIEQQEKAEWMDLLMMFKLFGRDAGKLMEMQDIIVLLDVLCCHPSLTLQLNDALCPHFQMVCP